MTEINIRDLPSDAIKAEIAAIEAEMVTVSHRLSELEPRRAALRTTQGNLSVRLNNLRQELDRRNRPSPSPRVSEHALLRYIERAMGIDVEAIRTSILSDQVVAAIKSGASGVTINGIKFVVQGATIVTTLEPAQRFKKSTKRAGIVDVEDVDAQVAEYYEERESGVSA